MKLTITSSLESREYTIAYLEVETSVGNFVILDNHEPIALILKAAEPIIFCRAASPESQETEMLKHGGILTINHNKALLLNKWIIHEKRLSVFHHKHSAL